MNKKKKKRKEALVDTNLSPCIIYEVVHVFVSHAIPRNLKNNNKENPVFMAFVRGIQQKKKNRRKKKATLAKTKQKKKRLF